jgi:hypothetical protein
MYVLLTSRFIKKEKVRKSLYAYLATYSLFAGTAVLFYPSTVFIETIGIDIQTMVHHGGMTVLGIFLDATGKVEIKIQSLFRAIPVFLTLATMAVVMNFIYGDYDVFNMFFIAPGGSCDIPVLSLLHGNVPYPVFLLIYAIGFTTVAGLMLVLAYGVSNLAKLINNKIKPQQLATTE